MTKVLFITPSPLGDAILTSGIMHQLIKDYPDIQLTIASGPRAAPLYESTPHLEDLHIIHKKKYSLHWLDLWKKTRPIHWDIIVDIRNSIITYFLKGKQKYIWKKPKVEAHRTEDLAKMMGYKHVPLLKLWVSEEDQRWAKSHIQQPTLALGPTATWIGKQWPAENFIQFINHFIKTTNAKVAVFGAPHEIEQIQPILKECDQRNVLNFVNTGNIRLVGALINECKAFLGNDSGLMHLAVSLGVPTSALFGPTNENVFGPRPLDQHIVIRPEQTFDDFQKLPDFSSSAPFTYMNTLLCEDVMAKFMAFWNTSVSQTSDKEKAAL